MNALLSRAAACALLLGLATATAPALPESRSPLDQVFQWSASGTNTWPDGSTNQGTLHLWVPEGCERVRGLLVLGYNVPEHLLVGHPEIRAACAENDLALVWSVRTFWNFAAAAKGLDGKQVEFLERLLADLAAQSGYAEIATAPWIPIGESGHLLMVVGLVNERPARTIAAICVKNPQVPVVRSVPMLWTFGTAQEWGQSTADTREAWRTVSSYAGWVRERETSAWPLGIVVEPATGHFACTDAMAAYFRAWIGAMVRLRLPAAEGDPLVPVALGSGVLAHLPLRAQQDTAVVAHDSVPAGSRARPWFPDATLARGAQALSTADWEAASQLVTAEGTEAATVAPFSFNSIADAVVEGDGTFAFRGMHIPTIPGTFTIGPGEPLVVPAGEPTVEWVCGPYAPLGGGRFRMALDRTWKAGTTAYAIISHPGADGVRRSVQPMRVRFTENTTGTTQAITFDPIADVPAGTLRVPLRATSSAGLPVDFFVATGPAVVRDGALELTAIPPRAKLPLVVTVTAWQWGRKSEPRVRGAPLVSRTFRIVEPFAHWSSTGAPGEASIVVPDGPATPGTRFLRVRVSLN